jgi:hypothetical protein
MIRNRGKLIFPMDLCGDGAYSPPGEVSTRPMTAEERQKYPPVQKRKVPCGVRVQRMPSRRQAFPKPTTRFSIEEGQNWREVLSPELYLELKRDHWFDSAIAKACGVSPRTFNIWKTQNGLLGMGLKKGGVPDVPAQSSPRHNPQ